MAAVIPALIAGGTALYGAQKASSTAKKAARSQREATSQASARQAPYAETGLQANAMIQNKLSSGELGGSFTPGDFESDPGYIFKKKAGTQALNRKSAAPGGGGYFSGQALKEAQQFGQGLADQTYDDAYNRWKGEQNNTYNVLSGQQRQGSGAATRQGGYDVDQGEIQSDYQISRDNARAKGLAGTLGAVDMFNEKKKYY